MPMRPPAKGAKAGATKQGKELASSGFRLDRARRRQVRRREGRYLLRTNLDAQHERPWTIYVRLTEVEQAHKELEHDLAVRPIFHRNEARNEAHIFVAFLAYCLQVTLKWQSAVSGWRPRTTRSDCQVQDDAQGGCAYPDRRRGRTAAAAPHAA
jgi:hypothetical protein